MSMTREEAIMLLKYRRNIIGSVDVDWCANETEALDLALSVLRGPTREQVERVWRGEWTPYLPPLGAGNVRHRCPSCGMTPDAETPFCAYCGKAMTDNAVDIIMERLEALNPHDSPGGHNQD